jgi:nodulation protein F
MNDDIAERIMAKIKAHASPDAGELTFDTKLDELGIHSLELTEIIFDLEDEFGIQIEISTVDAWSSLGNVQDIVDAVRALIEKKKG